MRGPRLVLAQAALCLAAAVAGGCASGGTGARAPDAGPPASHGSWLFRAEVEGRDGGGSVRLTLRRHDDHSFELAAADALGQTRWRVVAAGESALWIDVARSRFCRLRPDDGIPAGEFRSALRLADLPDLLLGSMPPPSSAELPASGTAELVDEAGRSFRGERGNGRWQSWTLRLGERPVLWYRSGAEGQGESMLSGREPAFVLRWRQTARGELPPAGAVDLAPPPGFLEMSCRDAASA